MKMYVGGSWIEGSRQMDVVNPFTGEAFDSVPMATVEDVELAIKSAERGAQVMRTLSAYDRYEILMRVVEIMKDRKDDFGRTVTREEGKIIGRRSHGGRPRHSDDDLVGRGSQAPLRPGDPAGTPPRATR